MKVDVRQRIAAGISVFTLLVIACGDQRAPDVSVELTELRRHGVDALPENGLASRVAHVGAGVLADVAGIVTSPDAVFVLDRDWKKIAVFGRDGHFQRVIFGGAGEGPGEFKLPVHLSRDDAGLLSVLDYELKRLSVFDEAGALVETIAVRGGGTLRHIIIGDTILVTGHGEGSDPIVRGFNRNGTPLAPAPTQTPEDQPFGATVAISRGRTTRALVSTRRPGVWMQLDGGEWSRTGQPLFPDMPPKSTTIRDGMHAEIPAQAEGVSIAELDDGVVLQGYMRFDRPFTWEDPPGRDEIQYFLAVFDPGGRHLDTVSLPPGVNSYCMHVDPTTNHVFLCANEPFPQVVEYELRM